MPSVRFDAEQRFTCQQCARCCRRAWDIVLTSAEAEAYRKAGAERWFRESEHGPEGATRAPFEPLPGAPGGLRIRKRADGACGFLSPQARCRIHEELGAERKPLACQVFPFRFHPADGPPVVTTSFSCPTVAKGEGETLAAQVPELVRLQRSWAREHAEPEAPLELLAGYPLPPGVLGTLREVLREMLDRPRPDGPPDLRANVGRMARTLEDLQRGRVLRLAPERFAEYLELTGRFAARSGKPVAPRPPSRLAQVMGRGFLFVVAAARAQVEDGRRSFLRLGLRVRLARMLLHSHGLGPGLAGYDLAGLRRVCFDLDDPALAGPAHNYLRASIETLGAGRRPVLDEIGVAVAMLTTASALAAMRAAEAQVPAVDGAGFLEGLMDASELAHAAPKGALSSFLGALAGRAEALYLFEAGWPFVRS